MGLQPYNPTDIGWWCKMRNIELLQCELDLITPLSSKYIKALKDLDGTPSAESPYLRDWD